MRCRIAFKDNTGRYTVLMAVFHPENVDKVIERYHAEDAHLDQPHDYIVVNCLEDGRI